MAERRPGAGQPRRTRPSGRPDDARPAHTDGRNASHRVADGRKGHAVPPAGSSRSRVRMRPGSPKEKPAAARGRERDRAKRRSYAAPAVWTKDGSRSSSKPAEAARAFIRVLLAGFALLGRGIARIGRAVSELFKRSRALLVGTVLVAMLLLVGLVDFGLNAGKAYPGVHVGNVDASGKTSQEIAALLEETYGPRIAQGSVVIYASDEAAADFDEGAPSIAEQQSAEEAKASRTSWTADAASLSATLPANELADEALSVGREKGGLVARIEAAVGGHEIGVRVVYDADELEALAADIDETIGTPRLDYGFVVIDGAAEVTEGSDGEMIDRAVFESQLDEVFLSEPGTGSFVAHAEYAPVRIDRQAAQRACDDVNAALADGARFISGEGSWDADATALGDWIVGTVEERDGGFVLAPSVDEARAKPSIVSFFKEQRGDARHSVAFESSQDGSISVRAQGMDEVPLAADTVAKLDDALFGPEGKAAQARAYAEGAGQEPAAEPVAVDVVVGPMPETLSFDEALERGVIEGISSYTTEFSTGSGTENRQSNIALVSEFLDNSIVEPHGSWSFNETSGERTAERGFLAAGAIVNDEYVDEEGGGVCQVATTVFNAVYDSGLPITKRRNHSLYIGSYPAGRDAAVSWPDLDLVWENDTDSAVLMRVTCTDSTVTAILYGVDPGYRTSTQVGEWEEGEKHKTRTEVDDSLSSGERHVKTRGTDGRKITIVRVVKDREGAVVREDVFSSEYAPITEVIVAAPDATAPDGAEDGKDGPSAD